MADHSLTREVDRFVLNQIESVPHLEALLLVWTQRPKSWKTEEIAKALYVPDELAGDILRDLCQRGLLRESRDAASTYEYNSGSQEQDDLVAAVNSVYRKELVRISRMIHAKAPSALREFARAFRITKDKEKG
jgi:hypothetical protein